MLYLLYLFFILGGVKLFGYYWHILTEEGFVEDLRKGMPEGDKKVLSAKIGYFYDTYARGLHGVIVASLFVAGGMWGLNRTDTGYASWVALLFVMVSLAFFLTQRVKEETPIPPELQNELNVISSSVKAKGSKEARAKASKNKIKGKKGQRE